MTNSNDKHITPSNQVKLVILKLMHTLTPPPSVFPTSEINAVGHPIVENIEESRCTTGDVKAIGPLASIKIPAVDAKVYQTNGHQCIFREVDCRVVVHTVYSRYLVEKNPLASSKICRLLSSKALSGGWASTGLTACESMNPLNARPQMSFRISGGKARSFEGGDGVAITAMSFQERVSCDQNHAMDVKRTSQSIPNLPLLSVPLLDGLDELVYEWRFFDR
ncbi:hypothetical protein LTS10_009033 [Elasticomyces elasticus]|nr:hypothetical protein LTS10_009033 [Elasticomyces elasticus]